MESKVDLSQMRQAAFSELSLVIAIAIVLKVVEPLLYPTALDIFIITPTAIIVILGILVLFSNVPSRKLFFSSILSILLAINSILQLANLWVSSGDTAGSIIRAASYMVLAGGIYVSAKLIPGGASEAIGVFEQKNENGYAIELIDVVKDYYVGPLVVHALRGVNLKVRKGEFIAIMGPSGSGKSTLLNMIGALDRPTRGKVLIDGIDISKLNDNQLAYLRNKKIGFVFQSYNLINRTNVLRNVEMPAIVTGMSKRERIERAISLLKAVGLEEEIYRQPKYLSGGQQQRVAIARALMNNPTIILADEPTGNLDSVAGAEVMKYFRKMNKEFGATVVVVTHDREVAETADRIIHLKDGKVVNEEILKKGE
ncbi:MAG: ABC transporter ATP-binding protein [Candidatus Njordarchaeia archaeon]